MSARVAVRLRPGADPTVLRLPEALLERVDAYAAAAGVSRSEWLRVALRGAAEIATTAGVPLVTTSVVLIAAIVEPQAEELVGRARRAHWALVAAEKGRQSGEAPDVG